MVHSLSVDANISRWNEIREGKPGERRPGQLALLGSRIDAAVAAGKYVWAAFGAQDGVSGGPSRASCAAWMRPRCAPAWQALARTQAADTANFNQSLAAFLVTRGPTSFFGFGCVRARPVKV